MIELEDIRFGYRGHAVFEGLDLSLEPGNVYGLLGLNGAGKSTLLRLLGGLLFPQAGRVRVLGLEPGRRAPALLSRIYMLPETPHLPAVPDRQFLSRFAPLYPRFDAAAMERLLEELAVPRGQKLAGLSLGEQKKFHLAFGLACQPSVLILDEPTNGLDIPSKGLFRRLVAEAQTEDRILILATHQVKDVELLIDRVLILHGGTLLCDRSISGTSTGFRFSREATRPDPRSEGLLYWEPHLGGFAAVWADPGAEDDRPDLELLFKAAIANPAAFRRSARGNRP